MISNSLHSATEKTLHPPKPVLTVRVGLVGHRWNRLSAESGAALGAVLGDLFTKVEAAADGIYAANQAFYAPTPKGSHADFSLVTGLAEGADQIGAAHLPDHWLLEALLAMPRAVFRQHLDSNGTGTPAQKAAALESFDQLLTRKNSRVTELPEPTGAYGEPGPFERLRDMLLRNVDVLIAVWDEQVSRDLHGGTGDVLLLARQAGLPVVVVPVGEAGLRAPYMLDGIAANGKPVTSSRSDTLSLQLSNAFAHSFSAPTQEQQPVSDQGHGKSAHERASAFFNQRVRWKRPIGIYRVAKGFFERPYAHRQLKQGGHDANDQKDLERLAKWWRPIFRPFENPNAPYDWPEFLSALPDEENRNGLAARLQRKLMPRFGWSDALAVYYSDVYRSSYLIVYLLSALAVGLALIGLFISHDLSGATQLGQKAWLVFCELLVLAVIWWLVRQGKTQAWHENWLDYRALAETLRHIRTLAMVGAHSRVSGGGDPMSTSSAWIIWYVRATTREIGLPGTVLDQDYFEKSLAAVRAFEIDEQIRYNKNTEIPHRNMHHFLHVVGDGSFKLAAMILFVFLVGYAVHHFQLSSMQERQSRSEIALEGESAGHAALEHSASTQNLPAASQSEAAAHVDSHKQSTGTWMGELLQFLKTPVVALAAWLPAFGAALAGIRAMGDFDGFASRAAATRRALERLRDERYSGAEPPTLEATARLFLDTTEVLSQDLGIWRALYGQKPLSLPA